jgi:4-amino-4-deoxy-L-arabinose transferase-like glycosyltransferase
MSLLRKTIFYKHWVLILFLLIHLFLFNINVAEWGDSYRILRASEFIRKGTYPSNEKRLPMFSAILAARPSPIDQVFWGRVVLLGFSVLSFVIFSKFLKLFIKDNKYVNLGLVLFTLNPVYLYWSIRIMADVPFGFFVLLAFYLLLLWKKKKRLNLFRAFVLGAVVGVATLTRFEGFILFGAIGLDPSFFNFKPFFKDFKKRLGRVIPYVVGFSAAGLPYFIFANPLDSSYFSEPAGRAYGLDMIWIYIASLVFMFGFVPALSFFTSSFSSYGKRLVGLAGKNISIFSFVILELLLILSWPAAVPRLFVPIIPFLILGLVLCIKNYFENSRLDSAGKVRFLFINALLLGFYLVSQYFLKLQFLVPSKYVFVTLAAVQIPLVLFLLAKKYTPFLITLTLSMLVWSFAVIYIHKDIFVAVKHAAEYASENLTGNIGYNDVSSVSDWYLNQKGQNNVSGSYFNFESDDLLSYESLAKRDFDYLLITNEHNTTMEIDLEKRSYLTVVKEFSYNVNSNVFFSKIVRFDR